MEKNLETSEKKWRELASSQAGVISGDELARLISKPEELAELLHKRSGLSMAEIEIEIESLLRAAGIPR